ncbi:DUF3460 family protein [Massilia sp. TS11]|uniref:DUF3460 family protein n=1 Tax=Massilia sp. TS11 TaxID=2908003 RepID=UPI001EDAC039|nr:DUF3460 family protein [Massilia sp. TS11]MCG2583335.1 DUF3460 family protein [Massilia sp. TS11]
MKLTKQFSMYVSDHDQFIKQLKAQRPDLEEKQREGRALLWDKAPQTLAEQARVRESTVKQQPYVYQNKLR